MDVVFASIDELNEMLGTEQQLRKSLQTPILKHGHGLDSLGFVNLVSLIEEEYLNRFGRSIILSPQGAPSENSNPFESVGSLVAYLDSLAP